MDVVFAELAGQAQILVDLLVKALVVGVVVLMLLRWLLLRASPFGWASYQVRRLTDPLVWPLASSLPTPNASAIAPLLAIVLVVLGAYFFKEITLEVLEALVLLAQGITAGDFLVMVGAVLYGAVSVMLVLIFVRILGSWLPFAQRSRLMWTVYSLTEPVMAPFRQLIPPIGVFDLSPILLIFLMQFVKGAIRNLLLQ